MPEINNGQVVPATAIATLTDSNNKQLDWKDAGPNTKTAEGSDGRTYTAEVQPQYANVTFAKKLNEENIAKINDPYAKFLAENKPKPEKEVKASTTTSKKY